MAELVLKEEVYEIIGAARMFTISLAAASSNRFTRKHSRLN
jgi:hypothetical protein